MSTIIEADQTGTSDRTSHRIGVLRLALTGAIVAGSFFLLCWIGSLLPYGSPTHAYLTWFTSADVTSTTALIQGIYWSMAFGAIVGALTGAVYNALWRLG